MKILIRLPNWLGDVVMSTAFIAAVKAQYPDGSIDVIIKKELYDIAALAPGINKIYPFSKQEFRGLKGAYKFGKTLIGYHYDIFFNLPESFSSQVLAYATRAKKRVGFSKEGGFLFLNHTFKKPQNVHRVDEYISLLERFTGVKVENRTVALNVAEPFLPAGKSVIVNFNSEASSRRMPLEKAGSLVKLLTKTFTETQFTFVGSKKEAEFVEQIIGDEESNRVTNLAGKTDLKGLAQLFAGAAAVLTTDSGPAHLANAVGTPTIVLFGAGDEHNTAPYNKQNLAVIRYGQLPCEPCVKNTCKLYGIPKCMQLLDDTAIIAALVDFIQKTDFS